MRRYIGYEATGSISGIFDYNEIDYRIRTNQWSYSADAPGFNYLYQTPGTYTLTVTKAGTMYINGVAGGGGSGTGGGGGGEAIVGAYTTVSVGEILTIIVGAGGTRSPAGNTYNPNAGNGGTTSLTSNTQGLIVSLQGGDGSTGAGGGKGGGANGGAAVGYSGGNGNPGTSSTFLNGTRWGGGSGGGNTGGNTSPGAGGGVNQKSGGGLACGNTGCGNIRNGGGGGASYWQDGGIGGPGSVANMEPPAISASGKVAGAGAGGAGFVCCFASAAGEIGARGFLEIYTDANVALVIV